MAVSAIKRTMVAAAQLGNRAEFAVLGTVAPAKAARKAALAFCTLPDNSGRRKDNRATPGEITYVRGPRGTKMVTEAWGEGPLVYIVHGWGGWRGQVAAFAEPIAQQGFRVVAFDALSHGESDPGRWGPRHSTGAELAESLESVIADLGQPHAMVAHSLGCCAAAIAVADGAHTDRLVFIAPNPDLVEAAGEVARYVGLRRALRGRVVDEVSRMVDRDIADFDIVGMSARAELPPTLVIHDRQDKEAPYSHAEQLVAAWPSARLQTTDGLGHHRILIEPGVVAAATRFVAD